MQRLIVHKNKLHTFYRELVLLENDLKEEGKEEVAMLIERMSILMRTAEDYDNKEA